MDWNQFEEEYTIENELLDGDDYRDYKYEDETSQFDPEGKWCPGSDCYRRLYRVRVPKEFGDDEEKIGEWLYENEGRIKYLPIRRP